MSQSNQHVNVVNPSCKTCGGPHHYFECQATAGFTQGDVYAATGNDNIGVSLTRFRIVFDIHNQSFYHSCFEFIQYNLALYKLSKIYSIGINITASRPDIAFATFVCARYQARPTEKHFKEVKRIFRYLRQSINKGLWYTKDSGFELIAYSNADLAGYLDDYKSTLICA
ncbi:hypothetical protein Tco_0152708 [Tanacetum coccineum]